MTSDTVESSVAATPDAANPKRKAMATTKPKPAKRAKVAKKTPPKPKTDRANKKAT